MVGRLGQGGTVLKRKELMISLKVCICCQVRVMKMVSLVKEVLEKTLIQIHNTVPHAQSVALGMVIAQRNGYVVMGVTCGSTRSVQI